MKKIIHTPVVIGLVLTLTVVLYGQVAEAQSRLNELNQPQAKQTKALNVNDVVELMQTDIRTHRKLIIANSMELSESESRAFWPLYREYQAALAKLNDRTVHLIAAFLKNYENLLDEAAKGLLHDLLPK